MEIRFKYRCDVCESKKILNERYDSYYCEKCDKWLEKEPDPLGEFGGRPNKPSKLTEEEKKLVWGK